MPNKAALAGFIATVAIIVPTAWHLLDADIQSDGPQIRPAQQTLTVGDATITVDLDRGVMLAGKTMNVTLVATAPTAHSVTLRLDALQDMGIGGERVQNPPRMIEQRKITIKAEPGGGTPVVESFTFAKARRRGVFNWFDVRVTGAGKHAAKNDDDASAAVVGIATWSGDTFAMAIEPPAAIPSEGPFTVAVRVKNTTKKAMESVYVETGATIGGREPMSTSAGLTLNDDYDIADENSDQNADQAPLPVGADRLFIYKITPHHTGITHFTFVAEAHDGVGGALDVRSFDRPGEPVQPTVAAK